MSPEPVYLNNAAAVAAVEESLSESERVRQALIAEGLETPMFDNGLNPQEKYDRIRDMMTQATAYKASITQKYRASGSRNIFWHIIAKSLCASTFFMSNGSLSCIRYHETLAFVL